MGSICSPTHRPRMFGVLSSFLSSFKGKLNLTKLNLVAWASGGSNLHDSRWDGSIERGSATNRNGGLKGGPSEKYFNRPNTWGKYGGPGDSFQDKQEMH